MFGSVCTDSNMLFILSLRYLGTLSCFNKHEPKFWSLSDSMMSTLISAQSYFNLQITKMSFNLGGRSCARCVKRGSALRCLVYWSVSNNQYHPTIRHQMVMSQRAGLTPSNVPLMYLWVLPVTHTD